MKSLITTLLLITGISMAQSDMPLVPQTTSFQAVITDSLPELLHSVWKNQLILDR